MIRTTANHLFAGALLLTLAGVASAQVESAPTPAAAAWELKGLTLGMTIDEVTAALPAVKCETAPFDTGLTTCTDWNNTLAEQKAIVRVKFLDGVAVFIDIGNINVGQVDAAAKTLTERYGPAPLVEEVEGQQNARSRDRGLWTDANRHVWRDGDVALQVEPFAWTNRSGTTYGAVILKDEAKHEGEWILRYNSKGKLAGDL